MKKQDSKNAWHWRKLDNVAKIFSLDDKNNTNIFRYSVVLKEDIDVNVLKSALEACAKGITTKPSYIGVDGNRVEYDEYIINNHSGKKTYMSYKTITNKTSRQYQI